MLEAFIGNLGKKILTGEPLIRRTGWELLVTDFLDDDG